MNDDDDDYAVVSTKRAGILVMVGDSTCISLLDSGDLYSTVSIPHNVTRSVVVARLRAWADELERNVDGQGM